MKKFILKLRKLYLEWRIFTMEEGLKRRLDIVATFDRVYAKHRELQAVGVNNLSQHQRRDFNNLEATVKLRQTQEDHATHKRYAESLRERIDNARDGLREVIRQLEVA